MVELTVGLVASCLAAVFVAVGLWSLTRNKYALAILTCLSCNPALWAINYVYLRNRWSELPSL